MSVVEELDKSILDNSEGVSPDSKAIRVLLFGDYHTAVLQHLSELEKVIIVVDEVRTSDRILARISKLQPDVILILTNNMTPVANFNKTIRSLCEANLTDRVAIMAKNPASYLILAIKSQVAALLPLDARRDHIASALCEVHASCSKPLSSLRTQPNERNRHLCRN